ncbi:hypothetical protein [Bradyrhizobium mercantei]|uniref:hypothetical protein n=1 Tax=Bradyrhizobium mercantei TaxID=1904807 RepID=UPI0009787449|nr:hypothetical protein [Bradyrhizobium mercantei]
MIAARMINKLFESEEGRLRDMRLGSTRTRFAISHMSETCLEHCTLLLTMAAGSTELNATGDVRRIHDSNRNHRSRFLTSC